MAKKCQPCWGEAPKMADTFKATLKSVTGYKIWWDTPHHKMTLGTHLKNREKNSKLGK
jgi:hypothetical protein